MAKTTIDRVYDLVTGDGACTKLSEQLVSPGTTIPWTLTTLGVPNAFSGTLVPMKDAGSLLPQLLVSAKIRAYPVRKWFWVVAAWTQRHREHLER